MESKIPRIPSRTRILTADGEAARGAAAPAINEALKSSDKVWENKI